ncbi:hypothetical protein F4780DRAFT_793691 [Xylariomycetidae sp. FL0641]|nr:hypothetical protein F4780DRAFT_793691 [Xylariomycetidae sp. FL0641]
MLKDLLESMNNTGGDGSEGIAELVVTALGTDGRHYICWKTPSGEFRQQSHGLPPALKDWLFPADGSTRDFATLQVILSGDDAFFRASDKDGSVRSDDDALATPEASARERLRRRRTLTSWYGGGDDAAISPVSGSDRATTFIPSTTSSSSSSSSSSSLPTTASSSSSFSSSSSPPKPLLSISTTAAAATPRRRWSRAWEALRDPTSTATAERPRARTLPSAANPNPSPADRSPSSAAAAAAGKLSPLPFLGLHARTASSGSWPTTRDPSSSSAAGGERLRRVVPVAVSQQQQQQQRRSSSVLVRPRSTPGEELGVVREDPGGVAAATISTPWGVLRRNNSNSKRSGSTRERFAAPTKCHCGCHESARQPAARKPVYADAGVQTEEVEEVEPRERSSRRRYRDSSQSTTASTAYSGGGGGGGGGKRRSYRGHSQRSSLETTLTRPDSAFGWMKDEGYSDEEGEGEDKNEYWEGGGGGGGGVQNPVLMGRMQDYFRSGTYTLGAALQPIGMG